MILGLCWYIGRDDDADRPWEAHFRGRPTAWWDRALVREAESRRTRLWRDRMESLGIPVPLPERDAPSDSLVRGGPDALPVLAELLASPNPWSRRVAVEQLTRLGPAARPALPALVRALGDDEMLWSAFMAIQGIGGAALEEAVPALTESLRSPNYRRRAVAAGCLQDIGPPARPAVPALLRLLADKYEDVRIAARGAVRSIDSAALAAYDRDHPGAKGESGR
jgi:HEAT repeat protein